MSLEVLLLKKGGTWERAGRYSSFCILLWAALFFPSILHKSQLAGRKWPVGCKMTIVIRFSLLCIKENIMQDSVKKAGKWLCFLPFVF